MTAHITRTLSVRIASIFALAYGLLVGGRKSRVNVPLKGSSGASVVPLNVVWGLPTWAYPRGGVCVGDVFLTGPKPSANVVRHEARHVLQWRRHGFTFPLRYFLAGRDAHSNRFEVEAGLNDGGYR